MVAEKEETKNVVRDPVGSQSRLGGTRLLGPLHLAWELGTQGCPEETGPGPTAQVNGGLPLASPKFL